LLDSQADITSILIFVRSVQSQGKPHTCKRTVLLFKWKNIVNGVKGCMENFKADVAVIGSGAGGMAAALTAAEKGTRVIVFEKTALSAAFPTIPEKYSQ
jgi:hypothetical protein